MKKVAIIRGKFLNAFEMQSFEPLAKNFSFTAFGSLTSFHDRFTFPTVKLPSPMDVPEFPYKMPILNRIYTDAQYLIGLENELKGFDIAHTAETYYRYTQQCLDAKQKGYVKKVICTVWETIPFNNEGIHGRKEYKARARKEVDHFLAVTQRAKAALLLEGVTPEKIIVLAPGVNISKFHPSKNTKDNKQLTILFAGRLERCKGIYELLFALKLLLMDREITCPIFLHMVGTGSEKNHILTLEKRLGIEKHIVHKTVPYNNMPEEYHTADIFVAPSKDDRYWQEQYNMTLMEAQASGLPIVTTTSGGIPENVGDAGLFSFPGDILSLREQLKQCILNPSLRLQYSRKARKRAEEIHDAAKVAKKMGEIYEKVTNAEL